MAEDVVAPETIDYADVSQAEYRRARMAGALPAPPQPEETFPPDDAASTPVDETPTDSAAVVDEIDQDESLDDAEEYDEPDEPVAKVPRSEKRIRQLNRQKNEARQEALREREERVRLEERLRALEQRDAQPAAQPQGPPDPDAYETHDDYVRASARHEAQQLIEAERQQRAMQDEIQRTQEAQRAVKTQFDQSIKAAVEKYEDFEELSEATPEGVPALREAVFYSDNPGELLYYFGQHPEEVARLNTITDPRRMLREIGRIEAQVLTDSEESVTAASSPQRTRQPRRRSAPPPVTAPQGDRGAGRAPRQLDQLSYQEYVRQRRDSGG